jgi:peptidoglycan/xylan/chitin deacetylase (PgdA/CDA1 family)
MATFRHALARSLDDTGLVRLLGAYVRRPCLLVLNYHRIGPAEASPFDEDVLSATAAEFRHQLLYLRDHFELPAWDELLRLARGGFTIRRPMALITFDDSYRDNFTCAFPVLRALGLCAAFFIPTDFVDHPRLAWWDRIA